MSISKSYRPLLYKNILKLADNLTFISIFITGSNSYLLSVELVIKLTGRYIEIEQESVLRQYGPSKELKPNPITQMGLFMDGDGIPLAFNTVYLSRADRITAHYFIKYSIFINLY